VSDAVPSTRKKAWDCTARIFTVGANGACVLTRITPRRFVMDATSLWELIRANMPAEKRSG
jgi:hypothetical protein